MTIARSDTTPDFFSTVPAMLPGNEIAWLRDLRLRGRKRFMDLGLPTKSDESWRYTDLAPLREFSFGETIAPVSESALARRGAPLVEGRTESRLVFINGVYAPGSSRQQNEDAGVTVMNFATAVSSNDDILRHLVGEVAKSGDGAILALNQALATDGVVVFIEPQRTISSYIEMVFIGDGAAAYYPRNLIVVGEGSTATIVETLIGNDQAYFHNAVTEIQVGRAAQLRHYTLEEEGKAAVSLGTSRVEIDQDGSYEWFGLATGARLYRREIEAHLAGEGSSCRLAGAYLLRDSQHCDHTTIIRHQVPNTRCREVFKGVLDGKSHGVFQGNITVERDAQHTDGHQLSKALLLSDDAEIDQKPELRIFANDVTCSHGAATGRIDSDQLFYLRTRGISEVKARHMLIEAFLADAFSEISEEAVREVFQAKAAHWFEHQWLEHEGSGS